jgi:hypothetical protein
MIHHWGSLLRVNAGGPDIWSDQDGNTHQTNKEAQAEIPLFTHGMPPFKASL